MSPIGARIFVSTSIAALVLAGCGTPPTRDMPLADARLVEYLAFLKAPNLTRTDVEAKIGAPSSTYEGGAIVGYRFWLRRESTAASADKAWVTEKPEWYLTERLGEKGHQLMIEYESNGRVRRYTLLQEL